MAKRPIIALLVARKLSSWKSHSLTPIYLYQRLKELIMFKGRSQSFKCRKSQGLSPMLLKTNSVYSACASHSHLFQPFLGLVPIISSAPLNSKEEKESCILPCLSQVFLGHHSLSELHAGLVTLTPSSLTQGMGPAFS